MKPDNLTVRNFHEYQQVALLAMHIQMETDIRAEMQIVVDRLHQFLNVYRPESRLETTGANLTLQTFEKAYKVFLNTFEKLITFYMQSAVEITFGGLAYYHNERFYPTLEKVINEAVPPNFFELLRNRIVDEAKARINEGNIKDGLQLSDRLWNLENNGVDKIRKIILQGIIDGKTVNQIAVELEHQINESMRSGASYAAIRLARTEVQYVYHKALKDIFSVSPWVQKVQVKISEGHKHKDICDLIVEQGENGNGIYNAEDVNLPFHPNCMCYLKPILTSIENLKQKVRLWKNGKSVLTDYATLLGGDFNVRLDGEIFQRIYSWT